MVTESPLSISSSGNTLTSVISTSKEPKRFSLTRNSEPVLVTSGGRMGVRFSVDDRISDKY